MDRQEAREHLERFRLHQACVDDLMLEDLNGIQYRTGDLEIISIDVDVCNLLTYLKIRYGNEEFIINVRFEKNDVVVVKHLLEKYHNRKETKCLN